MSRREHHLPVRRHNGRRTEPVRITTAAPSRDEDIDARRRRYLVSMAIRTACVIGAVLIGPGVLRWVLVAGAVLLPYVAVVMANATNRKQQGVELPGTGSGHPELPPGRDGDDPPPVG